ncbi:M55 family metallopeptidase [Streptomyces antimycoticus]|uniref:M55 family metallopeptidase n=3 Tax=Streptomyces TaxID=1883 RepID=A0ABD5JKI4_9ACTN|nr:MULTISPECIES: M55 family metallopeptidase [Streptomyces]MEE4588956.1 M55 family metallopeptidase [Streptomyces sp. DSM 41602]KUL45606.1 aminopeptidase [Streptomyces violaceusniger]QTI88190.1 M55 family metallopeptidase [Streptomyces sp. AgN23]RSS43401.1 aminopeptidase [Streptomyces sp. WAC05858]WJE00746.1 M55 family metallopeptidase [Streptomyces antimycoticus]
MKVYISVDMEGVAGIATLDQIVRGGSGYPRAQELMTQEANAAIAGAFEGGATSVVVNDSHGTMDNLLHNRLDPRARLVFGAPKAQCMAEGLTDDCAVALFVGYHAPAGAPGVLAHTFSAYFGEVRIDGARVSEAEVNGLYAASLGVPVGLVTGDDVIGAIASDVFAGATVVTVKEAHGFSATDTVAPSVALGLVREGAAHAVAGAASLPRPAAGTPLRLEVDMPSPVAAELSACIPGCTRTADRTVAAVLESAEDVLGLITVLYELALSSERARQAITNRR